MGVTSKLHGVPLCHAECVQAVYGYVFDRNWRASESQVDDGRRGFEGDFRGR